MVEVQCHHCGQVHRVPRDIFDERPKVDLNCPACSKRFQVVNPKVKTLRPGATRRKAVPITAQVSPEGRVLRLPVGKEITLRVLEGEGKGTVYRLEKARIIIGRTNGDVNIRDQGASRVHCSLEFSEDGVLLRDLSSTNGTLVNGEPIQTTNLASGSRFRVGRHTFELSITPAQK